MTNIQKLLMLTVSLATLLISCKHETDVPDDANPPVITITSPIESESIAGGVSISGMVTDESLHELRIKIVTDFDGSVLFTASPEVHDLTSYEILEFWAPAGIASEIGVTLVVTAEDHASNITTSEVHFTVKP